MGFRLVGVFISWAALCTCAYLYYELVKALVRIHQLSKLEGGERA